MLVDTDGDGLAVGECRSTACATPPALTSPRWTPSSRYGKIVARARGRSAGRHHQGVLEHQHPDISLDVESLASSRPVLHVLRGQVDETHPPMTSDGSPGFNTRARFVKALLDQMNRAADPKERELLEEALVLGLRAFEVSLAPRQRTMTGGQSEAQHASGTRLWELRAAWALPRVNLIVGENESGKSTLQQALVASCSASTTTRLSGGASRVQRDAEARYQPGIPGRPTGVPWTTAR